LEKLYAQAQKVKNILEEKT